MTEQSLNIPEYIRESYEELSRDLQNTYLKWKMYRQIFGSGPDPLDFLDSHAPSFFLAVRDAFTTDLVISVARFTDKTKSTLTLSTIIKSIEKSTHSTLSASLKSRQEAIIMSSATIKQWRDNLMAHKSLKSVGVSPEQPLPDLTWDEIDAVLEQLAGALNAIQVHFCKSETGYADIITHGDADEVLRLMRLGAMAEADELAQILSDATTHPA